MVHLIDKKLFFNQLLYNLIFFSKPFFPFLFLKKFFNCSLNLFSLFLLFSSIKLILVFEKINKNN